VEAAVIAPVASGDPAMPLPHPIEINALSDAFKAYTQGQGFCALTSSKTNFGHTLAASGLVSLSRGTAKVLGAEPVSQTIVEMAGGYLFVSSLSQGSTLTVYADRECDIGLLGYEMTMLANRAGHLLSATPRGGVPR